MNFFYGFIKTYWYYFVIGFFILILAVFSTYFFLDNNDEQVKVYEEVALEEKNITTSNIFVDVKGAVKTPGVYEMECTNIIDHVIKKAGGFTKKAYTNNINLSKKLTNEMVIYVYTKTEYENLNKKEEVVVNKSCPTVTYDINSCIDSGNSVITSNDSIKDEVTSEESSEEITIIDQEEINTKISINLASKEELMKLDGIGESKAESIIKYREETGAFKTIEDIKNVSGIGDAAYEKIKEFITI